MYLRTGLIVLVAFFTIVNSISFNLEPNTQKCLKEELQGNVPVIGEFEVSEQPGQRIDYIVKLLVTFVYLFQYWVILGHRLKRPHFGSETGCIQRQILFQH